MGLTLGCGFIASIRRSTSSGLGVSVAILLFADPDFPLSEEHYTYWSSLGRFVHRYAILEQEIHRTLCLYARTDNATSQAVFSGVKSKGAVDLIKRLREVRGLPRDADYDRAFAQFTTITNLRNDLLHEGAIRYPNGGFKVSNERKTIPRQQRITPISPADLDAMTEDLNTIFATLFVMQCEAGEDDISLYRTDFRVLGRTAWQYKSAPQASAPRQPRRSGRGPASPPPP